MKANGWDVHVNYSNTNIEPNIEEWFQNYTQDCGTNTFFGYSSVDLEGTVSYTFKGYGNATLKLGNCLFGLYQGSVELSLTGNSTTTLNRTVDKSEVIGFTYKKGDIMSIKEVGAGIIKLYSIDITCWGK